MSIKFRLTLMSFLQFFVWGAWLITVANYWFGTKQWSGAEFGAIFSTLGISSIIMPAITESSLTNTLMPKNYMAFFIF